ncbi:phosphatase PAP2 family protein [Leucothrix arctica]|nr:phosphatase PAP2 family protein [Leucothrix arctica]
MSNNLKHTAPSFPLITVISLVLLLATTLLSGFDKSLFLFLNESFSALPASFWEFTTTLSDPWVAPLLTFVIFFRQPNFVRALLICSLISLVANYSLKHGFDFPRPNHVLAEGEFNLIGPDIQSPSFPSGHTLVIFVMMGLVSFWNNVKLTSGLLFGMAALIALSRIALGVHWPSDVIFGALVGWLTAWLAVVLNNRLEAEINTNVKMGLYGVVLLCAIWSIINKTPYSTGQWLNTAVALFAVAYSLRTLTELMHRQKG